MAVPSKDLIVRIAYADIYVQMVAEGHAGNPDVADDLVRRANAAFRETVTTLVESGILDMDIAAEVDDE